VLLFVAAVAAASTRVPVHPVEHRYSDGAFCSSCVPMLLCNVTLPVLCNPCCARAADGDGGRVCDDATPPLYLLPCWRGVDCGV
jgi:hypothetical protein